jgi:hypothetical protein
MKRLKEGDIFYVLYKEKYFFGKILMDVSQRISTRDITMKFFHDCYLIGIYKGIYNHPNLKEKEFIIPSIYTQKKQFYSKRDKTEWHFYKNEPIDYKKDITFPENIIFVDKVGICFRCGELQFLTKLTQKDWREDFDIQRQVHFWYSTILMIACHYQNRDDLMDFQHFAYLEKEDLRFAEKQREEVYKQIGENINTSYYELALKHGFDLGRFYE